MSRIQYGVVAVTVFPKHNQRFIVPVLTSEGTGRQVKLLESGSDTFLGVSVLANDVEMHAFHHDVGVIDEARERPGEHLLLPVDVGGVDLDNECGV